jgi:hypothetical protein
LHIATGGRFKTVSVEVPILPRINGVELVKTALTG